MGGERGGLAGGEEHKGPEADTRQRLLEILKAEQSQSRFVSPEVMPAIAQSLNIGVSEVYGVATFYSFLESVYKAIGIRPGETTADGKFSLELTNCIGACDKAPAMLINHDVHGNLTPNKISEALKSYS